MIPIVRNISNNVNMQIRNDSNSFARCFPPDVIHEYIYNIQIIKERIDELLRRKDSYDHRSKFRHRF